MKSWVTMIKDDELVEMVYKGNLGAMEMMQFYQVASDSDIKKMEKIAKAEDFNEFKKLIFKVLKVKLEMVVSGDASVDVHKPKLGMQSRIKCPSCGIDFQLKG